MAPAAIGTSALDGPPPSPETDPAAAAEAGRPAAQVQQLIGGQGGSAAMGPGPDMSGIMTLGQKLEEGLLTLAQAAPLIAPDMEQARSILMNALGKFAASASAGPSSSSAPMPGPGGVPATGQPPTGLTPTQAGSQFPGAQGGGKPF